MNQIPQFGLIKEVYDATDESGLTAAQITAILSDKHPEWNATAINASVHSYLSQMLRKGLLEKRCLPNQPSLYARV